MSGTRWVATFLALWGGPAGCGATAAPPSPPAAVAGEPVDDGGAQPPALPSPLSIPAFGGTRDYAALFLGADGAVLWLHQHDCDLSVRTAVPPYGAVASEHVLSADDCSINRLAKAAASVDGRHVFVVADAIHHLTLQGSEVRREEILPGPALGLHLAADGDGDRLFVEAELPGTGSEALAGRVVVLLAQACGEWSRTALGEPDPSGLVALVGARGDGNAALWTEGSVDRWGTPSRIILATETSGGWEHRPLDFPGLALRPCDISAAGDALLLQGFAREGAGDEPGHDLYLARGDGGAWGEAVRVARDAPRASIYLPGLSSGGAAVCWEHFTRGEDGNTILRTEVRVLREPAGGSTEPEVVFERDEFFQLDTLACDDEGRVAFAAWSTAEADSSSFVLHAFVTAGGETIALSELRAPAPASGGSRESIELPPADATESPGEDGSTRDGVRPSER